MTGRPKAGPGSFGHRAVWAKRLVMGPTALALAVLVLAACGTADPEARNTLGNVSVSMHGTPPQVIAATERALRRLDMTIVDSESTDEDGRVVARSPRRRPVDVRVLKDVDQLSRVSVRIGAFGDETASIGLIRRIRRELERDPVQIEETPDADEMSQGERDA